MISANNLTILAAVLAFSAGSAIAGPCNTASRDAGSGNVHGYTGQTTGSAAASSKEHPPTAAMTNATEGAATSSEDAQRQMQGQATAGDLSRETKPAPSGQPHKMTKGAPDQTQPAPEQSEKMTAGGAEPAPSEKKPGDC